MSIIHYPSGGYPLSVFIVPPSEDLLCPICLNVLKDPNQCKNGHCFCLSCISSALKDSAKCPTCLIPLISDQLSHNLLIKNQIDKLIVKCDKNMETTSEALLSQQCLFHN